MRRAKEPLSQGFSRATRRGGLVIRSGRAAHETTLAGFEGRPGARHLYGEVFCDAIEQLQREALDRPRPELVVKVDRSGLSEHHPIVVRLHQAIDRVLRPIVQTEERRASSHLIGAPRAVTARDQVGLRALNDLLKAAFDQPGTAAAEPGDHAADNPPDPTGASSETRAEPAPEDAYAHEHPAVPAHALWFKQSPLRLHPGEKRTVTLLADPARVPVGTTVEIDSDPGLTVMLRTGTVPAPTSRGTCAVPLNIRARVTVEPGSRLSVLAAAGDHTAELEIQIVRHRASGWVREIARKNEDQTDEADFDPETGIVTVYEGRREFRELERAARHAGYTKKRAPEYVPVPNARGRSRRQRRLRLGRRADPRPSAPRRAPIRPRRIRSRRPPRAPGIAPQGPPPTDAGIPRTRDLRRSSHARAVPAGGGTEPVAPRRSRPRRTRQTTSLSVPSGTNHECCCLVTVAIRS